jgi:hypothetical protein
MTQKSYFFFFKLPFNFQLNFFTGLFVTSLRSRFGRRCRCSTQFLYWNCVVLARRSLSQRWLLSMTEEGLPPTFCSILIFTTYPHLASLLLMLPLNLSYFTDDLGHFSGRIRLSRHTCSNLPRMMPRYPTIDLFS